MLEVLKKRIKSKKGFTLVELMVVVSIIAVLAVVLLPRFITYTDRARQARATEDLNAIRTVITAYMADEGNGQPPVNSNDPTVPNSIAAVLQSHGIKWTGDTSGITDPWGNPYYYEQVMNTVAFEPVNNTLNIFNTYIHEQKFYLKTA